MSANKPLRSILTVRERERLRNQIEQDKSRLKGGIVVPQFRHIKEGNPERTIGRYQQFMDPNIQEDPGEIINRMRRYKRALDEGTPRDLSNTERRKLEKTANEDREWIKKNMVPRRLYNVKESDPEFAKAVEAAKFERSTEWNTRTARYQNAVRQLDPDTPGASSIENLRPS